MRGDQMEPYDNSEIVNLVIDRIQDQLAKVALEKFITEFAKKPNEDDKKSILHIVEQRIDGILEDLDANITDAENELELDIEEMAFAAELDEAEEDIGLFEEKEDAFGLKTEAKETEVKIDEEESETSWDDAE